MLRFWVRSPGWPFDFLLLVHVAASSAAFSASQDRFSDKVLAQKTLSKESAQIFHNNFVALSATPCAVRATMMLALLLTATALPDMTYRFASFATPEPEAGGRTRSGTKRKYTACASEDDTPDY